MKNNRELSSSTNKHPGGRPTKYQECFPQKLIDIMSNGRDVCSFCAQIGIAKDTFYKWIKKHSEFSDAYKRASAAAECWWQEQGIQGMQTGKDFNSGVFLIMMKNRFRWNERKPTYDPVEIPGYEGSLQQKVNAVDTLLKTKVISSDQHNQMIDSINKEAHIKQVDEHEKRLANLEENAR